MKLGAQLYTVHEHTKTLEDLDRTLQKVADIGYRVVQVSGTCAYTGEWMAEKLKQYGLTCAITHSAPDLLQNETESLYRKHQIFGCNYLGLGGMPMDMRFSKEGVTAFTEAMLPAARKLNELGGKLFYHNHAFELEKFDGKTVLESIAEAFPAELLSFTLDTYWIQAGGGDSIEWIEKLAGRLECVHLKDMIYHKEDTVRMTPIYEGNMNFDGIINACKAAGTEYVLVEQDYCYDADPFDCLKTSFDNTIARFPELR